MLTYFANCMSRLKRSAKGRLTQVPLLLHDSASAHRSHVGQATVLECGFEEMCHPPYSPNTSVNRDFGLKCATEEWLTGQLELL